MKENVDRAVVFRFNTNSAQMARFAYPIRQFDRF